MILLPMMRTFFQLFLLGALYWFSGSMSRTAAQSANALAPVPIQSITIDDSFWSPKRKLWQQVTIPDCFDKFEKDRGGALNNFDRVRDGDTGGHAGPPWYDGLIYEMIRGSADFLAAHPDPALENRIDGYIVRIAAAQSRDTNGYLNTWTELEHPAWRWGLNGGNDGWQHEMYNVGALCEAALHYYQATGKTSLLKVAVRLANYTCDQIGPSPKHELVTNHALAEEAFGNLYLFFEAHPELKREMPAAVDEKRYLDLAQYWVEARGYPRKDQKSYGAYNQDQEPVFEQQTIEGHAVRAALLYAGVTQLAGINRRGDYHDAAVRLWDNMCGEKMYVTGGIGATAEGEAFGKNYFLPNDGYLETCGAVAAGFFSRNLSLLSGDARYMDALERELYNGALAGVSLAGNAYSYVNPLESAHGNMRWAWNACPCCPPMFLKLMGAMPGYIYAQSKTGIYVNLFVGSKAKIQLDGNEVVLKQTTDYPWNGDVKIEVQPEKTGQFDLHVRIPGWCQGPSASDDLYEASDRPLNSAALLKVNGKPLENPEITHGYATVHRRWKSGDVVQLTLDMPVQMIKANANVEADRSRVALRRGPMIYCFEGADNSGAVQNLILPPGTRFTPRYQSNVLGGVVILTANAIALFQDEAGKVNPTPFKAMAIPYFANANRGTTPMQVWMAENQDAAKPERQD